MHNRGGGVIKNEVDGCKCGGCRRSSSEEVVS